MRRRIRLIVFVVTLPFGLLGGLFFSLLLLNMWNPMQLVFVSSFQVRNELKEPVWITPIGSSAGGGKGVLPQFATVSPAVPALRNSDLRIDPGALRVVHYDWDDINFSELLVRFQDGRWRVLVVDPPPPADCCYANKQEDFAITDLTALRPAPADLVQVAQRGIPFWVFMCLMAFAVTLPLGSLWWWIGTQGELRAPAGARGA